jgi:hypothetical protein
MSLNYKNKYLKYKNKYIQIKQTGGGVVINIRSINYKSDMFNVKSIYTFFKNDKTFFLHNITTGKFLELSDVLPDNCVNHNYTFSGVPSPPIVINLDNSMSQGMFDLNVNSDKNQSIKIVLHPKI